MLLNAENIRSKSSHPFNPHLHRNAPPLAAQNRKHFDSAPKTLRSIGRGQASVRASSRGRVEKQDTAIAEDAYVRTVWTEGPLSRERQSGDLGNADPHGSDEIAKRVKVKFSRPLAMKRQLAAT